MTSEELATTDDPEIPQLEVPVSTVPKEFLLEKLADPPMDTTISWSDADWARHRTQQAMVNKHNSGVIRKWNQDRNRVIRANALARTAHEQGVNETLAVMVPDIINTVLQVRDLTNQSADLLARAMEERDVDLLKAVGPIAKTMLSEQSKLLDRVAGKAVQRQEIKQDSTSTNTNINLNAEVEYVELDALLNRRRQADRVVDAEVIE